MTCREDDKSGCAWMCQIFVIQSKEGQKLYKEYPSIGSVFLSRHDCLCNGGRFYSISVFAKY